MISGFGIITKFGDYSVKSGYWLGFNLSKPDEIAEASSLPSIYILNPRMRKFQTSKIFFKKIFEQFRMVLFLWQIKFLLEVYILILDARFVKWRVNLLIIFFSHAPIYSF